MLDSSEMGIVDFPGHGRGAIALKDIPVRTVHIHSGIRILGSWMQQEDHVIFSFPRDLTLSTRTCSLPERMGDAWRTHGLHEGWVGLILCMMWEESRGAESKWSGYLGASCYTNKSICVHAHGMGWSGTAALPEQFDTPMFWPEDDIKELQGTAVVGLSLHILWTSVCQSYSSRSTDKIGREEAERDYYEKLIPAVKVRVRFYE